VTERRNGRKQRGGRRVTRVGYSTPLSVLEPEKNWGTKNKEVNEKGGMGDDQNGIPKHKKWGQKGLKEDWKWVGEEKKGIRGVSTAM